MSTLRQAYRNSWSLDDTHPSAADNFDAAMRAICDTDWMALPDFPSIVRVAQSHSLMGGSAPVRLGGLGLKPRQLCALSRAFERLDTGASHTVGYQNSLILLPMLFSGHGQFDDLVTRVATGQALGTFALTEPQGGSNMVGMQDFARREGDHWVLRGTKANIAHAQAAAFYLVLARAEGTFKIFAVPSDAPGVRITFTRNPVYMPRIFINDISFEDVIVPDSQVCDNSKALYDAMMLTRTYIAAGKLGHIDRCLDLLERHTSERFISTGLMKDNPTVRRRIENMKLSQSLLEAIVETSLDMEEEDSCPYVLAVAAKVIGVEAALDASSSMQCLFGAKGVDPSTGIPRAADDIKNWRIMEGAPEHLMQTLASSFVSKRPALLKLLTHPIVDRLPQSIPHADCDITSLGGAVAWTLAASCAEQRGTLTDAQSWYLERHVQRYLMDFDGPPRT